MLDAHVTQRIVELQTDYSFCIDDARYEEWPEFFTDTCLYKINTRQNVKRGLTVGLWQCESKGMLIDRVNSLLHANIYEPHTYRHLLGPMKVVAKEGDRIRTRTGFGIIRIMSNGHSSLFLTGLYEDLVA